MPRHYHPRAPRTTRRGTKHPMQPIVTVDKVVKFKENRIVSWMLKMLELPASTSTTSPRRSTGPARTGMTTSI